MVSFEVICKPLVFNPVALIMWVTAPSPEALAIRLNGVRDKLMAVRILPFDLNMHAATEIDAHWEQGAAYILELVEQRTQRPELLQKAG